VPPSYFLLSSSRPCFPEPCHSPHLSKVVHVHKICLITVLLVQSTCIQMHYILVHVPSGAT
jgi:hypothetical protein